jgi:imidazolonepropionase
MARRLLISHASQLITLAGPDRPRVGKEMRDLGLIEDGAVLIEGDRIVAVGSTEEIGSDLHQEVEEVDARGMVVMPGFVDAHTHPVFAGTRTNEYEMRAAGLTYHEIAARGGGIRATVEKTRAASEDDLLVVARNYARSFLQYGTTTIEAKTGYGLTWESELKLLRVIHRLHQEGPLELVPTLLAAHVVPEEYQQHRDEYIRMIVQDLLPMVGRQKLAEYHDVFCEQGAFTLSETRLLLLRAREAGLRLRLHANQFTRSGAAELAAQMRVETADHLEQIDSVTIAALRDAGVIAVLLPGAVMHLGYRQYPPARQMIDQGLPIVLATDFNPGSSPTTNMQMILSLACTQLGLTPAEAVTSATINAAYSLHRGERLGSIGVGKQADLSIFDCADYREIPYFYGLNHVKHVIKGGIPIQLNH